MKHVAPDEPTEAGAPPRRVEHRHPRLRKLLAALVVLALLLAAGGYGLYRHLSANITSMEIPSDVQGEALEGLPKGKAQNILVIGTDSRQNAADCKLGGSCGDDKLDGDTNADVEMLVHISADHESMTVMSIPRDTIVDLPACTGNGKTREAGTRGRINGSLNYGVDCQLRTVHELTGLTINHFMMVDFSGVVSLSDAVGGVDVCVDADVYDTYSHLKLAKGEHTLQGVAALQFVRTRHGFGDGSDLGRTIGQRLYLSSLQRKLESAGTLLNPQKVYRLAEAGTRALTVDSGLDSVSALAQVAATVGGVPASSTAFVTLPTVPDPENVNTVVPAEGAQKLFDKLAADDSLVKPSPKTSPSTASSATPEATSQKPSPSASATGDPATDGSAQTSAETTGCAQVSTQKTVEINGVPMTPSEAYAASPRIKDSDA